MSIRLFVGNLSLDTTETDIHQTFASHGSVVNASLVANSSNGGSQGLAFVTMKSDRDAQKALDAMNGQPLHGNRLVVSIAVDQTLF